MEAAVIPPDPEGIDEMTGLPVTSNIDALIAEKDESLASDEKPEEAKVVISPTALQLDDWSIRRGEELIKGSEITQKVTKGHEVQQARASTGNGRLSRGSVRSDARVCAETEERTHCPVYASAIRYP